MICEKSLAADKSAYHLLSQIRFLSDELLRLQATGRSRGGLPGDQIQSRVLQLRGCITTLADGVPEFSSAARKFACLWPDSSVDAMACCGIATRQLIRVRAWAHATLRRLHRPPRRC
jgi:hypothetical protein